MRVRALAVCCCSLLLTGAVAAPPPAPRTDAAPAGSGPGDAAAIRAARIAQNAAIVANDVDRIASFWTDDVVITRGLGAIVQGRDAYRAMWVHDSVTYQRLPERIEVSAAWPLAIESGTWRGVVAGSAKPVIHGRYSAQWLKRDGRWLIHSEVFVALGCDGAGCAWTTTFAK
jgi:ketosteroid isomerase-like protein